MMTASGEQVVKAANLLRQAKYGVALTGAGISTASGIPDFRSEFSGLWGTHDPLQVASLSAFRQNPEAFFQWVRPLLHLITQAAPNAAHRALAHLGDIGYLRAIMTQNIDSLHGAAGSIPVYELHGHIRTATCVQCFKKYAAAPYIERLIATGETPRCDCASHAVLKPDVILFGEQLPAATLQEARRALMQADLLLVIGSSLNVAPVNHLPCFASENGAHIIIINDEPTYADRCAEVVLQGDVNILLPELVEYVDNNR
jgi:NAD-dependent deacetylase